MLSLKFGYKWVAVAAASEPVVGRQRHLRNLCCFSNRIHSNGISSEYQSDFSSPSSSSKDFSSLEGYIFILLCLNLHIFLLDYHLPT